MSQCPFCGFEAHSAREEILHMSEQHPEVIEHRLAAAGLPAADYRHGPDLPSYLTLHELSLVAMFATRYAIEQGIDPDDNPLIGIHVRDRGAASRMPASWVEFSVGVRKFALWRSTGDLYEVGPDGAVSDDPIHRND